MCWSRIAAFPLFRSIPLGPLQKNQSQWISKEPIPMPGSAVVDVQADGGRWKFGVLALEHFGTRCAEGILGPVIHMSDKEMWRTLFLDKMGKCVILVYATDNGLKIIFIICGYEPASNNSLGNLEKNFWIQNPNERCLGNVTSSKSIWMLKISLCWIWQWSFHTQDLSLDTNLFSKWHPLNSSLLKSCMLPTHRLYKRDTFEPQGHHACDLWAFPAHTSQHWLRASPRRHQSKCVRKHSLGILASDLSKGTEDWLFFT